MSSLSPSRGRGGGRRRPRRLGQSASSDGNRGLSPVIGVVLTVAITIVLASATAGLLLGLNGQEQTAPHASIELTVDASTDRVKLIHRAGDRLFSDRTRLIWKIDGERLRSPPTDRRQTLEAGRSVTYTFDGSTAAGGTWSSYPSPGDVAIDRGDEITVRLYDTNSGKPVTRWADIAIAGDANLAGPAGGSGFIFPQDDRAGVQTTHEINWDIESGDAAEGSSLNNVEIHYPAGVDFSDVDSRPDVTAAGIDEDGDGTIDDAATVECCPSDSDGDGTVDGDGVYQGYSGDPTILRVEFQGNADIDAGETMIIRIQGIENPSAGSYTVDVGIDGAQTETGSLDIG